MKRDLDYIRSVLLEIEEAPAHDPWSFEWAEETPDNAEMHGALLMLSEAGYIRAVDRALGIGGGGFWLHVNLTWSGYEFLDTIRDEKVVAKAMGEVGKVTKSVSTQVLSQVVAHIVRSALGQV